MKDIIQGSIPFIVNMEIKKNYKILCAINVRYSIYLVVMKNICRDNANFINGASGFSFIFLH